MRGSGVEEVIGLAVGRYGAHSEVLDVVAEESAEFMGNRSCCLIVAGVGDGRSKLLGRVVVMGSSERVVH